MNGTLAIVLTVIAVAAVMTLILKKYNPVLVFTIAGIVLLLIYTGITGTSVLGEDTSGSAVLDVFTYIGTATKKQLSGVGANLMIVAAYAMFMSHIKASDRLAYAMTKPLAKLGNPYLILGAVYLAGILLKMMITSHAALSLLLFATTYPVLLRLGVDKLSAAATLFLSGSMDWGVNDGACIFGAETVLGISVFEYFSKYQMIPAVANIAVTCIIIMVYFRYKDKKSGSGKAVDIEDNEMPEEVRKLPAIYAVYPAVPLALVIGFSLFTEIKMDVFAANVIGSAVVLISEAFRLKSFQAVSDELAQIFKGMGSAFANILSLIIMGGVFAQGLIKLGGINIVFNALGNIENAALFVILALSMLGFFGVMVLGSGNATWMAFGNLIPDIAAKLGVSAAAFAIPMQLSASIGRGLSPVSSALLAVTGAADIQMQDLIKRCVVPIVCGEAAMFIASYVTLAL